MTSFILVTEPTELSTKPAKTMSSHINYRESFFQHPALTKITGDPTYTSLAKLERKCKTNAKSVRSDLGGGQQGHLGLISSAPAYARITAGAPFHCPALPAPPVTNGIAAVIAALRQHHYDKQMSAFNKCTLIERTIVQQIGIALDDDVLADLIDDATGLLIGTVPDIMRELYDMYGTVTPQALTTAKAKLEITAYEHSRPIANLFTGITDYAHMAEASGATQNAQAAHQHQANCHYACYNFHQRYPSLEQDTPCRQDLARVKNPLPYSSESYQTKSAFHYHRRTRIPLRIEFSQGRRRQREPHQPPLQRRRRIKCCRNGSL
jgi:hypothetical protein